MADGLYSVKLQGEKHKYELRGSEHHTLKVLSTTLSDLTGYKADYIENRLLRNMGIGQKRAVNIANNMRNMTTDLGTPHFIVKRVS